MGEGNSWGATIAVSEQSVPLTPTNPLSPGLFLPTNSASVKESRDWTAAGSPYGGRKNKALYKGLQKVSGQIAMDLMPTNTAEIFRLVNGTSSSAAVPNVPTTAPTITVGNGGANNLAASATFYYKKSPVWLRPDGALVWVGVSAESSVATTTGSNKSNTVNWGADTAPYSGWTLAGYIIWRTAANGASGSETYLYYSPGSGTSYVDDGSATPQTATPGTNAPYRHTMTVAASTPGQNPLIPFTYLFNVDQNSSTAEQYFGCYVDKLTLTAGNDPSKPVIMQADIIGLGGGKVIVQNAAYTVDSAACGWQTSMSIGSATGSILLEQWQIVIANNLDKIPALANIDTYRDCRPKAHTPTGSFTFGFESHAQWDAMLAGNTLALTFWANGGGSILTSGGVVIQQLYGICISVPNVRYTGAGGQQQGYERMTEPVPWICQDDPTVSYDMQVQVYNGLTSIAA